MTKRSRETKRGWGKKEWTNKTQYVPDENKRGNGEASPVSAVGELLATVPRDLIVVTGLVSFWQCRERSSDQSQREEIVGVCAREARERKRAIGFCWKHSATRPIMALKSLFEQKQTCPAAPIDFYQSYALVRSGAPLLCFSAICDLAWGRVRWGSMGS